MRNTLAIVALSCTLPFSAFGKTSNGIYYVDGFYAHSENVKNTISQQATGLSNACGPTSLMFIKNHFDKQETGIAPDFVSSISKAKDELTSIYSKLPEYYNSEVEFKNLKNFAKNHYEFGESFRRWASDGIEFNVDKLRDDIKDDYPALVVLDSYWEGNPTKNGVNIDHIVIVYAYQRQKDDNGNAPASPYNDHQNDKIYFYDPYYGGNGYFTVGEINTAVDLTGFAYLRVAP